MRSRTAVGWLVGLLSVAVALAVGELVATFVRPEASPLVAVGNRVILLTPQSAKSTAIDAAGTDDKALLIGGILVLLAVFGGLIGKAALAHLGRGLAGVGVIAAFGVYCALTANASRVGDIVPTLVGTAAGAAALVVLVRLARPALVEDIGPEAMPAEIPDADRRVFLSGAGAIAATAVVAGVGGRALQTRRFTVAGDRKKVRLPQAEGESGTVPHGADLGKSGVPWQTPNDAFYRIDTALTVPQVSTKDWRLRIHGMVDHPVTMTFDELLRRPLIDRWITLCCVSNEVGGPLISNSLFRGALLADLLREAGVHDESDQLLMTSVDGMTIGAPTKVVMDGRQALLAVGMNGAPLPIEHGFPVRVVVPGLYGYVSACKWVVDIEATTYREREAYWTKGGWAERTPIKMSSRIDRPHSGATVEVGKRTAIAGVAWDQHVGVSKVEVRIADGPWQIARLATVPSTDTWRQWVLPWTPEKSGEHRVTVRATDAKGEVQEDFVHDQFPAGATGLHSVIVTARD